MSGSLSQQIEFQVTAHHPHDADDEPHDLDFDEAPDDWELLEPDDEELQDDPGPEEPLEDEDDSTDEWRDEPYVEPDE